MVQYLDLYPSVVAAFPTLPLSFVIVPSFLWYLYINYTSFTLPCGRICATFCPSTGYSIFSLFCSVFSLPLFLRLLVCSVWAPLTYFILGCFFLFIPLYFSRHCIQTCHVPVALCFKNYLGSKFQIFLPSNVPFHDTPGRVFG